MQILLALMLTLFIETIIYFFYKPFNVRAIVITVVMNIILNVTMNLLLRFNPYIVSTYTRWVIALIIAEIAIVIIEAFVLYFLIDKKKRRSMIFSIGANSASLVLGTILIKLDVINTDRAALIATLILAFMLGLFFAGTILFNEIYRKNRNSNWQSDNSSNGR